jgi:hypothetical protein
VYLCACVWTVVIAEQLGGVTWANEGHLMGQYQYQTYNSTVLSQYPTCCWDDGGRQQYTDAQATAVNGVLRELWTSGTTLLAVLDMPALQVREGRVAVSWAQTHTYAHIDSYAHLHTNKLTRNRSDVVVNRHVLTGASPRSAVCCDTA